MNRHNKKKDTNENNKQNHSGHHPGLMMILCMLPIIAIMVLRDNTQISNSPWLYLLFLLCPLSHILMMRGMHKQSKCHEEQQNQ
jgi:Protein of unknown function (DUF2933)